MLTDTGLREWVPWFRTGDLSIGFHIIELTLRISYENNTTFKVREKKYLSI